VRLATLLLLTGIVLGPQGLAVLTPGVIELLRPAVAVALAVLGVTMVFGAGTYGSVWRTRLPSMVILAGALSLALLHRNAAEAMTVAAQAAGIAILLAGAGWLLSSARAGSDERRRVFAIAILLLLGGVADYLSVSALLLGWIAATAWRLLPAKGLSDVRLDTGYVQHPTTALLLITAGAMAQVSWRATLIAIAACAIALAVFLIVRQHQHAFGTFSFRGVPPAPAAIVVALLMDAARLEPRLAIALSAVVLAVSAFDALSGLARERAA
jgi:hypothetical protein